MRDWIASLIIVTACISPAIADDRLIGRWDGTYSCNGQRDAPMSLTVTQIRARQISAEFEYQLDTRTEKYAVFGAVSATGIFSLMPAPRNEPNSGVQSLALDGKLDPGGVAIEGTIRRCPAGSFRATRTQLAPRDDRRTPPGGMGARPSVPTPNDPKHTPEAANWIDTIRTSIKRLLETRATDTWAWRDLGNQIVLKAPRSVDLATRQGLLAELEGARAQVRADGLIEQLATGPARLSEGGMGRVIWVMDQAERSKWPKEQVERVRAAARTRAAQVARPELQAARSMANDLPATLASLMLARTALAPLDDYRAALVRHFGTIDPEKLAEPLFRRIVEIETSPGVAVELRAALAEARRDKDPRLATEDLLRRALGPDPASSPLAAVVSEGRELAELAAIQVVDRSSSQDQLEPTAADIATFAHSRAGDATAKVGQMFRLKARIARIEKINCSTESAGSMYVCSFLQKVEIVFLDGGPLSPDIIQKIDPFIPGGYKGDIVRARFTRSLSPGRKWDVVWGHSL